MTQQSLFLRICLHQSGERTHIKEEVVGCVYAALTVHLIELISHRGCWDQQERGHLDCSRSAVAEGLGDRITRGCDSSKKKMRFLY